MVTETATAPVCLRSPLRGWSFRVPPGRGRSVHFRPFLVVGQSSFVLPQASPLLYALTPPWRRHPRLRASHRPALSRLWISTPPKRRFFPDSLRAALLLPAPQSFQRLMGRRACKGAAGSSTPSGFVRSPARGPRPVRVLRGIYQRCLSHRNQALTWSWTSLSRVPFCMDDSSPTEISLVSPSLPGGVLPCSCCLSLAEASSMLQFALQISRSTPAACTDRSLRLLRSRRGTLHSLSFPLHQPKLLLRSLPSSENRLEPAPSTAETALCICPSRAGLSLLPVAPRRLRRIAHQDLS